MTSKTLRAKRMIRPMLEALEDRQLLDAGGIAPLAPLTPFASLADFDKYFLDRAVAQYGSLFGKTLPPPGAFPLPVPPVSLFIGPQLRGPVTSPSSNPQTPGVDEGDIVQSDATHLYVLTQTQIVIMEKLPGGGLRIDSRINVPTNPKTLFLDGTHLTVVSQITSGIIFATPAASSFINPGGPFPGFNAKMEVSVFDVSNAAAPARVQDTILDGAFVTARAVGDHLYLVARNDNANLPAPQIVTNSDGSQSYETQAAYVARIEPKIPDLVLPQFYRSGSSTSNPDPIGPINAPTDVYQSRSGSDTTFDSILTFDMSASGAGVTDVQTLLGGYVTAVYATANHIYLVSPNFQPLFAFGANGSIIQRFDVQGNGLVPGPAGFVPTLVQSQFGLDEQNGLLRVVGISPFFEDTLPVTADDSAVSLFVLAQDGMNLNVVGSLERIDQGNQLTASRFVGDELFLATSPLQLSAPAPGSLHVINLSDPAKPSEAGQVQMAGQVGYLQMLDATHLLGLGLNSGIELSLFDVADADHPGLIDQAHVSLADSSSYGSILGSNPQSLTYSATQGLLAIPAVGTWTSPGNNVSSADFLYQVDLQTGFHLVGTIAHDSQAQRNLLQGNELYSIADGSVVAQQLVKTVTPGQPPTFSFGASQVVRVGQIDPQIEYFLRRLYQNLLLRTIDPGALDYWAISLKNGVTRGIVAQSVLQSAEYRSNQIRSFYSQMLDRTVDDQGMAFWLQYLTGGHSLDEVRANILDSPEYLAKAGSLASFVSHLYADLLGRQADPVGQLAWQTALSLGLLQREQVISLIAHSPEAAMREVMADFQGILHRPAETQALLYYAAALQTGSSTESTEAAIYASNEYFLAN